MELASECVFLVGWGCGVWGGGWSDVLGRGDFFGDGKGGGRADHVTPREGGEGPGGPGGPGSGG